MTLDDLDWYPPESDLVPVDPKPCRHFRNRRIPTDGGWTCGDCGKVTEKAAIRRGKNNRKRGLALQLEHARRLGLTNLQGNGAADAKSESTFCNAAFVAQFKAGLMFPGWMQRELDYLPRTGGRTPLLVIVETPGPGRKARALVVMDESDFIDLHGGSR